MGKELALDMGRPSSPLVSLPIHVANSPRRNEPHVSFKKVIILFAIISTWAWSLHYQYGWFTSGALAHCFGGANEALSRVSGGKWHLPPNHDGKPEKPPKRGDIDWQPCAANASYSCGWMTVPKDYFNETAGFSEIAILKVPATGPEKEKLGSIFLNPGGPGGSGVSLALQVGVPFQKLLEGKYDLIGFDPRGIGATKPLVECFPSRLEHNLFKANTILEHGFDLPPDPFGKLGIEHLKVQHAELMSLQEAEYKICGQAMGEELRYMGTSTVVRDIEEMSRVLDGAEKKINFWGGSYGTILGAYLVNMIPEKIGRVVIDGVASAPQWANDDPYTWLKDWMVDTEKAYQWFLNACVEAGPGRCALAALNLTTSTKEDQAKEIEQKLEVFLNKLYLHPIPVIDGERPGILTAGTARAAVYESTNMPSQWPIFAEIFAQALSGNVTAMYNYMIKPLGLPTGHHYLSPLQLDMSRAAVVCGDATPIWDAKDYPTVDMMVKQTLKVLNESSRHFGASVSLIEPDGGCQFWPTKGRAPERFTGPWNASLATPMLIISNTADPITPLASGKELHALMGKKSSQLLVQNSAGHCSLGSPSTCTFRYWTQYFINGSLPEDDTICEMDNDYFPSPSPSGKGIDSQDLQDGTTNAILETARAFEKMRLGQHLSPIHIMGPGQGSLYEGVESKALIY